MNNSDLKPAEILDVAIDTGETRASFGIAKLVILGFLAGAFIAFAAQGSNIAAFNLLLGPGTYGLGRCLAGAIFATGLILVVIGGGELFTGNVLMLFSLSARRIRISDVLRNWIIVYIANLAGSLIIVIFIYYSNQLMGADAMIGAAALKTAVGKVNLGFMPAMLLGILCNWLVCMAVWMSFGAKTVPGKAVVIFFPIWLFVTSGFEHSVANMYYIPIGILAKGNPAIAAASGLPADMIDSLTWGSFFIDNLLPVTIGNIIGGGVFVAMAYYYSFRQKKSAEKDLFM